MAGHTASAHSALPPVLRSEAEQRDLAVLLVKRKQVSASWAIVRINGDNPQWKCVPVARGHKSQLTASRRLWLPPIYAHLSL